MTRPWPPWRISSQRPVRPPRCTGWRCQHRTKPNDDLRWLPPTPSAASGDFGAILFGVGKFGDIFREKPSQIFFWMIITFDQFGWIWCIFQQKKPHFSDIPILWGFQCAGRCFVDWNSEFLGDLYGLFWRRFPGSSATGDHGSAGPGPRILRDWLPAKWWINGIFSYFCLEHIKSYGIWVLWVWLFYESHRHIISYQWFFGVSNMLEAPNKF